MNFVDGNGSNIIENEDLDVVENQNLETVENQDSDTIEDEVSDIIPENDFNTVSDVEEKHSVLPPLEIETENHLYDIARLLSLRPTAVQPPRPTKLNPPPNLNILWDGSLDDSNLLLSARSVASTMSAGSGFTTPRVR